MHAIVLCLASFVCAADVDLRHDMFEVGQVGRFWSKGSPDTFRVRRIIDDTAMVVGPEIGRAFSLIVKGRSTTGLADGKVISLPGRWKISGTEKYAGRTLYVAEPYTPPPPKARTPAEIEAEKKRAAERKALREADRKRAAEYAADEKAKRLERERLAQIARNEKPAAEYLAVAVRIHKRGETEKAVKRFKEIIKDYPGTKAAAEATKLLKEIEGK